MSIVGGLDIHRKQLTYDLVERETGRLFRGQIVPADRAHLAVWLEHLADVDQVELAVAGGHGGHGGKGERWTTPQNADLPSIRSLPGLVVAGKQRTDAAAIGRHAHSSRCVRTDTEPIVRRLRYAGLSRCQ